MTRRGFIGALAAGGALAAAGRAQAAPAAPAGQLSFSKGLPDRGQYLVRQAYVMTMDLALGDLPAADVHVRNGEIIAIGAGLNAPHAQVLDGRGMIVLPGLIETHWHMWNSLLRSMAGDQRKFGYFPTSAGVGKFYEPSDMYCGTGIAAAEAINSGITTVHDWCHNPRTPAHAEENLRALREAGIRARFSYGPARGIPVTETLNLADVERLHREWNNYSNGGLIQLGLAWRGVQYAVTGPDGKMEFRSIPPEVFQKEYDTARSLGIPISAHVNIGPKVDSGHVEALDKRGLLYPDLQLIHMISTTRPELDAVAKANCSVSFSPYTEMRTGFGLPRAAEFLDAGIRVGLAIDTTTLSGDADMFAIMKVVQNVENAVAFDEFKMPARRALELATIMGAKSLGVDKQVGSLTPGKRADLIMVDTRQFNLGMFTDPAHMVVEAAQPSNVELVMVDGRILKQRGKLTAVDSGKLIAGVSAANANVRKRAGWW
jgi:cytosine/adenosine deaminase-related metal-dependent hydrolase